MIYDMFKRLLYGFVGVFGIASMSVHMYHPENNATLVLCAAVQNSSDMSSSKYVDSLWTQEDEDDSLLKYLL